MLFFYFRFIMSGLTALYSCMCVCASCNVLLFLLLLLYFSDELLHTCFIITALLFMEWCVLVIYLRIHSYFIACISCKKNHKIIHKCCSLQLLHNWWKGKVLIYMTCPKVPHLDVLCKHLCCCKQFHDLSHSTVLCINLWKPDIH